MFFFTVLRKRKRCNGRQLLQHITTLTRQKTFVKETLLTTMNRMMQCLMMMTMTTWILLKSITCYRAKLHCHHLILENRKAKAQIVQLRKQNKNRQAKGMGDVFQCNNPLHFLWNKSKNIITSFWWSRLHSRHMRRLQTKTVVATEDDARVSLALAPIA